MSKAPESVAQLRMASVAGKLAALALKLELMAEAIPEESEAILEGREPWTVRWEVKGTLESVADQLKGLLDTLMDSARKSPIEVEQDWKAWKERTKDLHL